MTSQVHLPPWAGLDEVFFQYLLYRGRALPPRLRFAAFRGLPSHTEKSYGFHALYPLPLLAECMLRTISVSCLIDRVTGRPYSEGPRGRQPALCGDMFDFHPGALGSTCTPRSLFSAASRCTPPKCLAWCSSTRRVRAHAALGARCAPVMILRGASASWCHPRPGVAAAGLGSFGESATPQRRFSPMRQICAGFGSQSILFVGHVKLPYARASGANPFCCGDCCFRGGSINETRLLRIATTAEECVVQAMARLGSRGSRTSNRSRKELWHIQL